MPAKKENIVRMTLDLSKPPPPLTPAQKARLEALAAMSDEDIDYSDDPPMPEDAVWMRAASRLPRPKQQITLRLDADILDFFRETGSRYQTRINSVLRAYVDVHNKTGHITK